MSPFEALYGRKCNILVNCDKPMDRIIVGLDMLRKMEEQVDRIKQNLKKARDRKKSVVDRGIKFQEFKVGDHVFLKAKAKTSSLHLGTRKKVGNQNLWTICDPEQSWPSDL